MQPHTARSLVTKTALGLPEKEKELQALKVEHEGLPVAYSIEMTQNASMD